MHELLVRIRIRGSIPTNIKKKKKKRKKISTFFCFLLSEGTFTLFLKYKSHKKSHKTAGINVMFYV
jgi:hypothetical protein